MNRLLILNLACVSAALPLRAQQPAPTSESVESLLQLMKFPQAVDAILPEMENACKKALSASQGGKMTVDQQKLADKLTENMVAEFRSDINWEKLKSIPIKVFTDGFTREELDVLVAFFKTPEGPMVLKKFDAADKKVAGEMERQLAPFFKRLNTMIEDAISKVTASKR